MTIEEIMNTKRITAPQHVLTPVEYQNNEVSTEKSESNIQSSKICLKKNDKNFLIPTVGVTLIVAFCLVLVLALLYGKTSNTSPVFAITNATSVMRTTTINFNTTSSTNVSTADSTMTMTIPTTTSCITTTLASFSNLFTNNTRTNIYNSTAFVNLRCLATITINCTLYNLAFDGNYGVYFFDSQWQYHSVLYTNFTTGLYMIVLNSKFYFSSTSGLFATYYNSSNQIIYSYGSSSNWRDLAYFSANGTILATNYLYLSIDVLSKTLNLISSISLSVSPHAITVYGSNIYFSSYSNRYIYTIYNGITTTNYTTLCTILIKSLTTDSNGYIAMPCIENVYLYDSSFTYTNKQIEIYGVGYAGVDTQGRLALATSTYIHIYN